MIPTWSQEKYIKALRFAAERHKKQKVPGTDWSYTVHLSMVSMEIIAALAHEQNVDGDLAIQAALLHDVIEDTDTKYEEILSEFGQDVADGVQALTKEKKLPEQDQMGDSLERIRSQPREISMVKLADRITNLQPPPAKWDNAKKKAYWKQAGLIYKELKGGSVYLSDRLKTKINAYQAFFVPTEVTIENNRYRVILYQKKDVRHL